MVAFVPIPTRVAAVEIGVLVQYIGHSTSCRRAWWRQSQCSGVLSKPVLDEICENLLIEWMGAGNGDRGVYGIEEIILESCETLSDQIIFRDGCYEHGPRGEE